MVRRLVPNGFLWADANGGYEPEVALEVAPQLADAGVDVLEAALKPNRISGYQALKRQGALPILMDEGVVSPVELAEFIRLEMIDGVAMKPSRCGGLESARRQIELIEDRGLMWFGQRSLPIRIFDGGDFGFIWCLWFEKASSTEWAAVSGG